MNQATVDRAQIQAMVKTIGRSRQQLVPLLHAIHDTYHYLPAAALQCLSELTDIPPAAIMGVATFYTQFRLTPAGKHLLKVCIGTACHVKGAEKLHDDIRRYLRIPENGDTDPERLFTVTKVACLGCCMLAPAVQIDHLTYGPMTSKSIGYMLYDFLQGYAAAPPRPGSKLAHDQPAATMKICLCSSCAAAGSEHIHAFLHKRILREKLPVTLKTVGCTGASFQAPLLEIETADHQSFRYGRVQEENVEAILTAHFKPKNLLGQIRHSAFTLLERIIEDEAPSPVTRYLSPVRDSATDHFLSCQKRLATQHSGQLDPLNLDEYLAQRGFEAMQNCRRFNSPAAVIEALRASGLRGRGGAGYPTYLKWREVSTAQAGDKYIICNGDEGDPGAFMDRMLMESFPFRVLEGMAIAAFACNIQNGFIFLRAEYPLAIARMQKAIRLCEEKNLLAGLSLELVVSAGAFVCGEETAMIAAIEGRRGNPRFRPPYPAQQGVWQKPTLINNVETFALVPWILLNGASAFSALGTSPSPGTKTFALAGKVQNGGLIEVEMGTTLRDIIFKIGGGIRENKALKAVQIGGPAGGCIPAAMLDTPVDFEALKYSGAIMGSGGMIVLDEDDCMVDIAKYFMRFTQNESCGKCTFCRVGTMRLLEILEKLTSKEGRPFHLAQLKKLAREVQASSLCGLGRAAPNPVLSALRHFEHEFIAHSEGRCPAKKCAALITYRITDSCIGCTKCAQNCPADAIAARPYQQQEIDQNLCTKCDVCRQVCPQKAVVRE
ncbi:NAD(P)H-dependent oxidoreductase subunit E [candidate division FCPU426 bacterium]|nr:NAD(P)H-dependent oxidoreductase subunit E [candidate division FCPU426 bacterium]